MYKGNKPQDDYELIGEIIANKKSWEVYKKDNDNWINYKIIAIGKARGKANYWMSFSEESKSLKRSNDSKILSQEKTALFESFCRLIKLDPKVQIKKMEEYSK